MPRSKRAKVVHLSKTPKKGKELTIRLFSAIREAADKHQYIYVFDVANMRNTYLKDVRAQLSDSRLFFGKTKVMAKSLGHSPEDEHLPALSALTPHLTAMRGLLFTPRAPESVLDFFADYTQSDFARAGVVAPRDFTIPEGIVYSRAGEVLTEADVPVNHTLEPMLRKLGVPTRLVRGKVVVEETGGHVVCREGDVLSSEQTALLKCFGVAVADFKVSVKAWYDSATQKVAVVEEED